MREMMAWGRAADRHRYGAQQAVDPHAHHQSGAERLDVDVARAQLDGLFQHVVDGADHRSAAGEVAQALDVVFVFVRLLRPRPGPRHRPHPGAD